MIRLIYVAILTITLFFQLESAESEYTTIPNEAKLPISTPSLANAKTLKIRLKNGLEAYLISDPDTDKSAAGLTVRVGSWDEPKDHPGLAHFLEHMLFLGTSKYPKESEYNRFITEHGGSANAFTSDGSTSFMFAIDNSAFPEALDRFAYFFKEPLFNPSGVARELNAIDQEYAKDLNSDDFRELFVLKELGDPAHPFHAFNIGNSSTLSKVSQETLKKWYHTHYSSNLMKLVVLSPLPLDQLRHLVVESFKDVPDLHRQENTLQAGLFLPSTSSIIYVEPIKNMHTLSLLWDLPPKFSKMRDSKPESIVCYVLGHEGKESLLAELKRENLADSITCGSNLMGPNNAWLSLEVGLTEEGLKNLDTVIERSFQALARFREVGVPQYLFDEVKQLSIINYQYQPRDEAFDTVMRYASWLAHSNMERFPEQDQVIEKFDPVAVKELLDYLTPQNSHIDVVAPAAMTGIEPDRKETWMGVAYAVRPISKEQLLAWEHAQPNPRIDLPAPNPFIPQHLDIVNVARKETSLLPHPHPIIDNAKGKIFFAADHRFLSPKISWIIEIRTPSIIQGNAQQLVLGDLFVKGVKDMLDAFSYPATMAGLNFDIARTDNGIQLTISGYSDKAPLLLSEVLKHLEDKTVSEQQFKIYKSSLTRQYQNFGKDNPVELAHQLFQSILYKQFSTEKEKANAIRKISYSQFTEFARDIFAKTFVRALFYGNMTEDQAKEIGGMILKSLPGEPYAMSEQYKPEVIVLPKEKGPFFVEAKVPSKGNVAWLTIQGAPPFTFKHRAAQQVIMQDLNAPFFEELRTKQQTGYLVFSGSEEIERQLFSYFAVQSNTHDSRDLLARFELFLERYLQELPLELTEERFEVIKLTLIETLKQPVRNLSEMAQLLNMLAFKYDGDFDWLDKRVASLKELKLEECIDFARAFLGKDNKRRIGLLLYGQIPPEHDFEYTRMSSIPQLRKLGTFVPR